MCSAGVSNHIVIRVVRILLKSSLKVLGFLRHLFCSWDRWDWNSFNLGLEFFFAQYSKKKSSFFLFKRLICLLTWRRRIEYFSNAKGEPDCFRTLPHPFQGVQAAWVGVYRPMHLLQFPISCREIDDRGRQVLFVASRSIDSNLNWDPTFGIRGFWVWLTQLGALFVVSRFNLCITDRIIQ